MLIHLSDLYYRLVISRPLNILALLLVILLLFCNYIKDFKLDASADSLLLEDDKDLKFYRDLTDRYRTRDFLFVSFTPYGDLFSDAVLAQIGSLKSELEQLELTDSVVTILDVPLVKQVEGSLSDLSKNFRTLNSRDVDRLRAKRELITSPLFKDLVISTDGQTTALQINLIDQPQFRDLQKQRNKLLLKKHRNGLTREEDQKLEYILEEYDLVKTELDQRNHENIVKIRKIMKKYEDFGVLYLGGVTMIADDMITFIKNDLIVFGVGVFVFLLLMLSIIFRQIRWVLLPLASCIYAGLLMIGLLGFIGWRVTVISSNFISLMLIITMSMNIHLIVRYRQLRKDFPHKNHKELVAETTRKMVWPCLYTALTTIMAFTSLVVSDIKPVIDFGWMMTIGLTVTFLTSFLLFPSILVLLGKTRTEKTHNNEVPFTRFLAGITRDYGNSVLFISVLLAAVSAYGISQLMVENSFINYFSKDTEIHRGLKLIDEKLGGTTPLDILIKFPPEPAVPVANEEDDFEDFDALFGGGEEDEESDYWFTEDKVNLVKKVHDYLEGLPPVGKVLSLASLIRVGEDVNKGTFDAFELAIVYKRMPEELKSSMIDPYISIEDNEARINMRILDSLDDLRRNALLEKINTELHSVVGLPEDSYQVSGLLVLYNNMLQSLFRSQIMTLGVVMAGIALMLLLLFRSASLAIIGIIPNLLAAAIILGLMGIFRIPLDMMTITIAAITIGIAVDNSIHYIYRFREEYSKSPDYTNTLFYCHANIGRAVFYTAITIIIGFSILAMSNFIPTIYFGILTAFAMLIALFAALTLLPKLILLWKPFK